MGKIILESDLVNTQVNWSKKIVGGIHLDSVRTYESLVELEKIVKKFKAKIFFSHDMEWFNQAKKGTNYYT